MIIRVDSGARILKADDFEAPCAVGRSGAVAAELKREGDGATPCGRWPVRAALLRPDRVGAPETRLPWRWLRPADGWSDDPADPVYNRPVRHPHDVSSEKLWRDDSLYDAIVVLGHNDTPPVAGLGSAIFLHCWNEARPTEGCVAIERERLLTLVARLAPGDVLDIA